MSNMAAPPQLVETVPYRIFTTTTKTAANPAGLLVDVSAVERFAEKHRAELKGNWVYAEPSAASACSSNTRSWTRSAPPSTNGPT